MFKRILLILVCLLMLMGILAGCQGATTTTAATTAATTKATTAATTAATTKATTTAASKYPAYINTEGSWPVVKDGSKITVKFYTTQGYGNAADFEKNWYLRYLKDKSKLDIQYTQISVEALAEQKNLIMASGDLPDMMYSFNFNASELVNYGQEQKLLLDFKKYIDPTLTPNLTEWMGKRPDAFNLCILPDGGMYSLPRIDSSKQPAYVNSSYWNTVYLKALGKEIPRTLDEAVAALYLFKEKDPAKMGSKVLPVGASDKYWMSITDYFLNAFGFLNGGTGAALCLNSQDKVVYAAREDVFVEYLKVMNKFYKDGIISKDFYTLDDNALMALCTDGKILLVAGPTYCLVKDRWPDFDAFFPLTSKWQPTPKTGISNTTFVGGFAISAKTKYPEACVKLADWFFTIENAVYIRKGPYMKTQDTYGLFDEGWHIKDNLFYYGNMTLSEFDASIQGGNRTGQLFIPSGNESVGITGDIRLDEGYNDLSMHLFWAGQGWVKVPYNMKDGDDTYKAQNTANIIPYAVTNLGAGKMYFNAADTKKIADYRTAIDEYADKEIAKFITGARDLSEFSKFQTELDNLGVAAYVKYYTDAYAARPK
jgi:putative aldouronate transport system substrate-binding protein